MMLTWQTWRTLIPKMSHQGMQGPSLLTFLWVDVVAAAIGAVVGAVAVVGTAAVDAEGDSGTFDF